MKPASLPASRANAVIAAYLLATLPLLARAAYPAPTRASLLAVAAQVALLAVAVGAARARDRGPGAMRIARDWLPLLLLPVLYAQLPQLIAAAGAGFQDARVIAWESALFGAPARTLAAAWPSRGLSELLHLGYLSYYPLIYAPPLLLYARRRHADFGATVLAVTLAYVACFAVFVLFPVEGPRYLWPEPAHVPDGPVRRATLALLAAGSSRGAAFPSSHAAVAVAQAVAALRLQRRVGIVAALSAASILVGAVHGGFHYAVDMAAGAAVGVAAAWGALRWSGASAPDEARRGRLLTPAPARASRSGRTPPAPPRASP